MNNMTDMSTRVSKLSRYKRNNGYNVFIALYIKSNFLFLFIFNFNSHLWLWSENTPY